MRRIQWLAQLHLLSKTGSTSLQGLECPVMYRGQGCPLSRINAPGCTVVRHQHLMRVTRQLPAHHRMQACSRRQTPRQTFRCGTRYHRQYVKPALQFRHIPSTTAHLRHLQARHASLPSVEALLRATARLPAEVSVMTTTSMITALVTHHVLFFVAVRQSRNRPSASSRIGKRARGITIVEKRSAMLLTSFSTPSVQ